MLAHCFGSLVLNKGVNNMNNPQAIFLSIAVSIGVFLLLREVFCWYFKINKRLSVLQDIKNELVKANSYNNPSREPAQSSSKIVVPSGKRPSAYTTTFKPTESFWRAK
jgi:hypothetical protein